MRALEQAALESLAMKGPVKMLQNGGAALWSLIESTSDSDSEGMCICVFFFLCVWVCACVDILNVGLYPFVFSSAGVDG